MCRRRLRRTRLLAGKEEAGPSDDLEVLVW